MDQNRMCGRCGSPLNDSTVVGYCLGCLLREGLEESGGAKPEGGGQRFGNYELLEKIGQGGMGVVYRAWQVNLARIVAVKLLPFSQFTSAEAVQRFQTEASVAAGLQHPNIVAIHDVGEHEGQHYFSMDFIEGRTLAEIVREKPLPAKRAATYLKTVAEAVHYAHAHGILHRDLKPSNILIDAADQPRITDFGLAKRLKLESDMTLTGQMLGSPNFMAPEQAEGHSRNIGPATDIYALGAILYQLLTRQPPFQADTLTTLLKQVVEAEPLSPRLLNPSIPRDLETICLKCLEKEPARRYPTAQALANDLARFLEGQSVLARPIGSAGRAWRWSRRNPRLATAAGLALVSLLSGLTGVTWQWRRAEVQRRYAEAKELQAQQNAYVADMNLAQRALEADQFSLVLSLLEKHRPQARSENRSPNPPADLRGWEWRYLWRLCQPEVTPLLAAGSGHPSAAVLSGDGRWLAAAIAGKQVNIWDLDARHRLVQLEAPGWVSAMAFSADDRVLAVSRSEGDKPPTIECWELPLPILAHAHNSVIPVRALAFSPDTRLLATLDGRGLCEILEWRSGRSITSVAIAPFRRGEAGVLAFSPDGKHLAIGGDYGALRVMDLPGGGMREINTATVDGVSAVAFSPDSELLAACFAYTGQAVWLWRPATGEPQGQLTNAAAYVRALAFSPDGRHLAAASVNGSIALWNVAERTPVIRLRGHPAEGRALAFGTAGQKLISACGEKTVCSWDLARSNRSQPHVELPIAFGLPPNVSAERFAPAALDRRVVQRLGFAFSPDSRSLITTEPGGAVGLWDARTVQQTESLASLGSNCWQVALSPDGRWLALGEASGCIRIWSWPDRRLVATLEFPYEFFGLLRFSSSGRFLIGRAVANNHRIVYGLWRTNGWVEVAFPPLHQPRLKLGCDLSPDDRLMAIGYDDGALRLWDFPSGRLEATFTNHQSWVNALVFSQDGRRLASASLDRQVFVWDMVARCKLASLRGHSDGVWSVAFSPDGKHLATGGKNSSEPVKLWDLATERELLTLRGLGLHFLQVGYSPDGNTIMATSLEGVAHLWRTPTWEEIKSAENERAGR